MMFIRFVSYILFWIRSGMGVTQLVGVQDLEDVSKLFSTEPSMKTTRSLLAS